MCSLALLGRFALAAGAILALVVLNHSFYALLVRRLGLLRAVAGVALHAVHHLVGAASVVTGLAVVLLTDGSEARSRRSRGAEVIDDASVVE